MRNAYLVSSKSKDPRTKIGAVLVHDKHIVSSGFNGLPIGTNDFCQERFVKPEKTFWFEHAERNAIYTCARYGVKTEGAKMITNGIPCPDCARAIIQSGVCQVTVHKQWMDYEKKFNCEKWESNYMRVRTMFSEANVAVEEYDMFLDIKTVLDGNEVIV